MGPQTRRYPVLQVIVNVFFGDPFEGCRLTNPLFLCETNQERWRKIQYTRTKRKKREKPTICTTVVVWGSRTSYRRAFRATGNSCMQTCGVRANVVQVAAKREKDKTNSGIVAAKCGLFGAVYA